MSLFYSSSNDLRVHVQIFTISDLVAVMYRTFCCSQKNNRKLYWVVLVTGLNDGQSKLDHCAIVNIFTTEITAASPSCHPSGWTASAFVRRVPRLANSVE